MNLKDVGWKKHNEVVKEQKKLQKNKKDSIAASTAFRKKKENLRYDYLWKKSKGGDKKPQLKKKAKKAYGRTKREKLKDLKRKKK